MEEVHLWRGSREQRALRSQVAKSGQFAYFNRQLDEPDWTGRAVLDFGGNAGNLLRDSRGAIRPEDYYCLDVLREAIDLGRERYPEAHWLHYNRYNCSFNPGGLAGAPVPRMEKEFQMILAFSVFTHTTREEMHDLIGQLRARLAPGGRLAFTFIDPHYNSWPETYKGNNLRWRLEKNRQSDAGLNVDALMKESLGAEWCALVDGSRLFVDGNGVWGKESETCMTYNVYYTVEFLRREFPAATIRAPVNGEMQHCCIIGR